MQSESLRMRSFLGRPQQYVLPIFQRKYSWTPNVECKTLFENIIDVAKSDDKNTWYIGAIVCQNKGGNLGRPVYVLIDGQQRLTTLTLMICAMTEYLRKHPKTGLDEVPNWDTILKECVIYSEGQGDNWYRLLLNNEDKDDLKELVSKVAGGEDVPKYKHSRIFGNYHWFKRNINKNNIKLVWDGLRKLEMIHINLDETDVAQNIFETLNSTGRSLKKIDQIRNYLLMGLEPSEAEAIYNYYWRPMERSFNNPNLNNGSNHFDWFTRYYLMFKLNQSVNTKDVYDKFRIVSNNYENAKECIKEITEFSNYYLRLFGNCEEDKTLKKEFSELNTVAMRMMTPFLMKIFSLYDHEEISKDEFLKLVNVLKAYYMRISVANVGKSVISSQLPVALNKLLDEDNGVELVINHFIGLKGEDRFISDSSIREMIHTRNFEIYKKNHFVLSKLVNYGRQVPLDTSDLEVVKLCENVSESHSYKIGNFTLENIDLCMDIDADSNEEFIDKRTEMMIDLILRVWEYPTL